MYDQFLDNFSADLAQEYDIEYDLLDEEDEEYDYAQPANVFLVFLTGYQAIPGQQGRQPVFRRTQHRIGARGRAVSALFPQRQIAGGRGMQSRGLWVQGGLSDVRRYLQQLFPGQQLSISTPEAHGAGRSHVHVTMPGRGRSEHIFYGSPPRPDQTFFD
jgi:hypothetical protein